MHLLYPLDARHAIRDAAVAAMYEAALAAAEHTDKPWPLHRAHLGSQLMRQPRWEPHGWHRIPIDRRIRPTATITVAGELHMSYMRDGETLLYCPSVQLPDGQW